MRFKDRLKELRKELNMTQEEFAKKIGFSRTAISAWEIGRNEPSNDDTIKLADFFSVTTDYLLGKTDIRNSENKKELDIKWGLSGGYKALNDTNREIARSVIESLLAKQEQEKKEGK